MNKPIEIYQWINVELERIINSLSSGEDDLALSEAKKDGHYRLSQVQQEVKKKLAELEKNSEWNVFTIAFYGETGAGKSTIIETIRILLKESKKLVSQTTFRKLKIQYIQSQEVLQKQRLIIEQIDVQLVEIEEKLSETRKKYEKIYEDAQSAFEQTNVLSVRQIQMLNIQLQQSEQSYNSALEAETKLQVLVDEKRNKASLWEKFLNLFRKVQEETDLRKASGVLTLATATRDRAAATILTEELKAKQDNLLHEEQLSKITKEHDSLIKELVDQRAQLSQKKQEAAQHQQEYENQSAQTLAEMEKHEDGKIIGDGRPDFTQKTQHYHLELDGQKFALLDVPGIEGKEGLVLKEIERAVQTAHAVFYVTNQAAPPQTGDEVRLGTLQKIKQHLGDQTEVWAIYNKKITNPKHSLKGRPLISEDEIDSLAEMNNKMRDQLGKHYREVIPLTAYSAFLASTDHFAPESKNARNREKILRYFNCDELLDQSRIRAFLLQNLGRQLVQDCSNKITRANFNKAKEVLDQTNLSLKQVHNNLNELSEKLHQESEESKLQLASSLNALKKRLDSRGKSLIDDFENKVRNRMYSIIEGDVSNDNFKDELEDEVRRQKRDLSKQLPVVMGKEIERFQNDVGDILKRFEEHARELNMIYALLNTAKLKGTFNFNFNLDNGIKVGGLLLAIGSGVLAVIGTGGWILVLGLAGVLIAFGKAIWSAFDADYRKSQQRKNVDDNLRKISDQMRKSLQENMKKLAPEMQDKIFQLEQAIESPSRQAADLAHILDQSVTQLNIVSRKIATEG